MDKGEWRSYGESCFCKLRFHKLNIVVQVGDDASVVGDDPSNVDEKGGSRPAGSGACGNEG